MGIAELKFLVVEDHEFQRGMVLKTLAALGATQMCWATDGLGALQLIQAPEAATTDIIISDLDMPGMDGMELMRHLGAARTTVSVILASALDGALLASVETMAKAYGITILGVIEKPVTAAKLAPLINRHRSTGRDPSPPESTATAFTFAELVEGLNRDQFEPFFQPKLEMATGRIKGAEALARWRHPQKGIVEPLAFIEIMENNGLIDTLTWQMVQKSAAFCQRWAASAAEVTIAVNLSVKSLTDVLLAERLTELVRGENLDPCHMIFEVTESATTDDFGVVLENLSRLRMKGFGLSLDDYGTGYSSMQQLTLIPFTELKIDQSFINNAARQQSARIIIESSLEMAKRLTISSVAEGVETQQDWDLLRQLGSQLAQGYFIARPMAAETFTQWARRHPCARLAGREGRSVSGF
ncbi:MAG: EAL domain-containing response regulator [Desulfuromonadales bacterium]|nr:EAL domain-containing response regulator [Desulfuromonadales bacterium]